MQIQILSRNSLDNIYTQGERQQGRDAEESFMLTEKKDLVELKTLKSRPRKPRIHSKEPLLPNCLSYYLQCFVRDASTDSLA